MPRQYPISSRCWSTSRPDSRSSSLDVDREPGRSWLLKRLMTLMTTLRATLLTTSVAGDAVTGRYASLGLFRNRQAPVLAHAQRLPAQRRVVLDELLHRPVVRHERRLDFAAPIQTLDELALLARQGQDNREQFAALGD